MRVAIEDGTRLFVDVDGAGLVPDGPVMVERPTIVLLHGGPGSDHSLFKASGSPDYTDVAQVVFYDHRGKGRSDPGTPEDWRLDVWADDVVRLCDALGIVAPIVVGESFGGFVAQRYLARHPDHPAAVVLGCTAPRLDVEAVAGAFARFGGPEAEAAARDFWTGAPDAIIGYLEHCIPLYSIDPVDMHGMARSVMNLEVLAHFQAGESRSVDLAPGLAAATCPVLVAAGELDPVCPVEMSEEIVAALVNAEVTFERYPEASHTDVRHRSEAAVRRLVAAAAAA